jgi:hypothetical protein
MIAFAFYLDFNKIIEPAQEAMLLGIGCLKIGHK